MIIELDPVEELLKTIGIIHGQGREFAYRNALMPFYQRRRQHEAALLEKDEALLRRCDA